MFKCFVKFQIKKCYTMHRTVESVTIKPINVF